MESTILLAKVFGIYFLLGGLVIMVRQDYFMPVLGGFAKERLSRLVLGAFELLAALFLVVLHFDFSSLPAAIITLIGISAVCEGLFYFAASDKQADAVIKLFNVKAWYTWGGAFAILLGAYLAWFGFGI